MINRVPEVLSFSTSTTTFNADSLPSKSDSVLLSNWYGPDGLLPSSEEVLAASDHDWGPCSSVVDRFSVHL